MEKFERINKEAFEKAEKEHVEYLDKNPDKRAICDDTITPFFRAMKSLGYVSKLNQNDGMILRKCINEECRQLYSSLYLKNSVEYWGCPHCQRIS
jgi:hypothetical protein